MTIFLQVFAFIITNRAQIIEIARHRAAAHGPGAVLPAHHFLGDAVYSLRSSFDRLLRIDQGPELVKDVQVIASTLRPLDSAVAEGAFRSDLYYLLSGMTLLVPSLGERSEDIPLLVTHFLAGMTHRSSMTLAADALIALQEHRVFVSGSLWGINSFDQWGVELGKVLAKDIEARLTNGDASGLDGSTAGLLAKLRA